MGLGAFDKTNHMFSWQTFSPLARTCIANAGIVDEALQRILSAASPPPDQTDEIGRPLLNCWRSSCHPDLANYKRIMQIRRSLAAEEGYSKYTTYTDHILGFVDQMAESDDLFIVLIVTEGGSFEFLYAPSTQKIMVSEVSQLPAEKPEK